MSGVGGGVGGYWLCARLSICIVSRQAIVNLRCQVGTQPNQTAPGAAHNARQLIKSWHGQRQRRPSSRPKAARNRCQLIWLIVLRSDPIGQISNVTNCQMLLWPAELVWLAFHASCACACASSEPERGKPLLSYLKL